MRRRNAGARRRRGRWRRVADVFNDALEVAAADRGRFLDTACGSDHRLRLEVERLLATERRAGDFLEAPAWRLPAPDGATSWAPAAEPEQRRIGPYRLVRRIHRGRMSWVYLARRVDDGRRVALKIVPSGGGAPDLAERCRREQRTLARLEHPNIARLYDGGTTPEGHPYLVMEYIDGSPIDRYCADRAPDLAELLGLLGRLCAALHFVHRHLLAHGDVKPDNILVTRDGVPKLLDFGIAMPLAGAAPGGGRNGGPRWLSRRYASPEQLRGEPPTAASDVYSLGLLAYELVTGSSPHGEALEADLESLRTARERRPPAPSATAAEPRRRRALRGDLDAVLLRALEPLPERRYATAEELGADLERHLEDRPVSARPATLAYRSGRLLRRHRHRLAVAALLLATAAAFSFALYHQHESLAGLRQRSRAALRALAGQLTIPREVSDPPLSRVLLESAADRARAAFAGRPLELASMLDTLGELHLEAGWPEESRRLLEESLALRRAALGEEHWQVVRGLTWLAAVARHRGEPEEGERLLARALEANQRLFGAGHPASSDALEQIGGSRWEAGDYREAESYLRRALELRESVCEAPDLKVAANRGLLAGLLAEQGRALEAESLGRRALDSRRRLLGDDHPEVAASLDTLGDAAYARGDYDTAVSLYRSALQIRRRALGEDHPAYGVSLNRVARALGTRGDWDEAVDLFRRAIALGRRHGQQETPNFATLLNNLAVVLADRGEPQAARALLEQVLASRLRLLGEGHPHVAQARYTLARVEHDLGRLDEAEAGYRLARERTRRLPEGHPARSYPRVALARLLLDHRDPAAAEAELRPALAELRRSHPAGHWRLAEAESLLAAALLDRGEARAAEPLLLASYRALRSQRGPADPRTRRARALLGRLYGKSGDLLTAAVTSVRERS